jgi:hypothetical protein
MLFRKKKGKTPFFKNIFPTLSLSLSLSLSLRSSHFLARFEGFVFTCLPFSKKVTCSHPYFYTLLEGFRAGEGINLNNSGQKPD